MTRQDRTIWHASAGMAGPAVLAFAIAVSPAALAQSAGTLELPQQIGQPQSGPVAIEDLTLSQPASGNVYIEEIAPPIVYGTPGIAINPIAATSDPQPVTIMQTEGGRDLCDPSVAEWERQQAGIDCKAIEEKFTPKDQPIAEIAADPLLTPSEGDAKDTFDNLGLGADVPATVILQK